jgi:predicted lipid-binding transport protein (Tim44 family)
MEDPTTIALNLTFFATLAVAAVMFLGLFLVFVATLVIAGVGRLVAVIVMATVRALRARPAKAGTAKAAQAANAAKPAKPAKKEPALAPEWAAAVARADARAAARAKAEAAPPVKVSVRELPSPKAPADELKEVAPLVESAMDRNGELGAVPRAFAKLPMPAAQSVLDTGSLVSLPGRLPLPKNIKQHPPQVQERKAG